MRPHVRRAEAVKLAIRGFYAVLDRDDEALARSLVSVCRVLQVRLKPRDSLIDTETLVRVARMARRITSEANAALVINDRVDIALLVGADGVHLGQTDLPIADARRIAGSRLWIGVSTHDLEQVRVARDAGADYLGFGPVFETATKQNPDPVQGIDGLRTAVVAAEGLPVVAIGGITAARAREIYDAGVAALCAISAVNTATDLAAAARALHV
jgi:thiamine-phosphate pyrophosphorylase